MKKSILLVSVLGVLLLNSPILSGQSANTDQSLSIITYNIWNGFDWGKDAARHNRFLQWAKKQAPDVFALQELCGYTEEKLKKDAATWGHPYSILLKTSGYPVGITSNQPIQLKEKLLEGLWHGALHVTTYGIDFFVVHLSPSDYQFRMREAAAITQRVKAMNSENYILLGDFNAVSPMDAEGHLSKTSLLERYRASDHRNEKYANLRDEEWDYAVMSSFLSLPAIDVIHRQVAAADRYTFPSPILIGSYYDDPAHVERSHHRIDYILVSPGLAPKCTNGQIFHDPATAGLSDHFPVRIEIQASKGGK